MGKWYRLVDGLMTLALLALVVIFAASLLGWMR